MAKKTAAQSNPSRQRRSRASIIAIVAVIAVAALITYFFTRTDKTAPGSSSNVNRPPATPPAKLDAYEIVNNYPHDPQAFLQGLVWYDNGFYEGTGLEGRSTLRRVEFPSGKAVKPITFRPSLFAKGVLLPATRLFMLTGKAYGGFA